MIKTVIPIEDPKTRQITGYKLNTVKLFVRPFWLTPQPPNNNGMALAAAVGAPAFAPFVVTQEGPFQGYSLVMESDRFTAVGDHEALIQMTDSASRKNMSNRMIHANCMFGTPEFPLVLPERWFIHENAAITINLQNLFANANVLRPTVKGRRIYQTSASAGVVDDLVADMVERATITNNYIMTTTTDMLNLVAGVVNPFQFPVDADAYFEIFKATCVCYEIQPLGAPTRTGTFDFILRDAETRRQLMSGNMSNLLAFGTAQQPEIFPESWVISPKSLIEIEITNTTPSGNPISVYLAFLGRKIYI